MLQRNSTERATLEEILCDKWVTNNNKEVIDVKSDFPIHTKTLPWDKKMSNNY